MPAHLLGSASLEPHDESAIGLLLIRLARMKLIGAGVFSDRWGETPDHVERLFLVDAKGARGGSGANGTIWPAMMSAELPEGWA